MRLFHVFLAIFFILCLLSCEEGNEELVLSTVTIQMIPAHRLTVETELEFKFSIPHILNVDVGLNYVTRDGNAVAGIDFIFASGSVIIPSGSLSSSVTIKVKPDSLRREPQFLYLNLSNPINCTLDSMEVKGTISNSDGLYWPVDNGGYSSPVSYPGYALIWRDEFDGKVIDENNWSLESGSKSREPNELEYYTNRTQNCFVSSGNLIIEARKEKFNGGNFTSARITTKGKKSFKHGRIDIRARVPIAQGTLSSLWMLGSNIDTVGRPSCGEIDLMQLGRTDNSVDQTLHWGSTLTPEQFGFHQWLGAVTENTFHVFSAVWDVNHVAMFIDDKLSFDMVMDQTHPFDNEFFFIFSLAVGGDWAGPPDDNALFPQRMVIDYVRVFQ